LLKDQPAALQEGKLPPFPQFRHGGESPEQISLQRDDDHDSPDGLSPDRDVDLAPGHSRRKRAARGSTEEEDAGVAALESRKRLAAMLERDLHLRRSRELLRPRAGPA
jgi:hypothetical protein